MADTAMGPAPLERQESVPMEIMNKCAYGEPSTKTIMIMGAERRKNAIDAIHAP